MPSTYTVFVYEEKKQIAGKIYDFLPRNEWPQYAKDSIDLSKFGGMHSMLVIGGVRGSGGTLLRAFTITSTQNQSVDPADFIPITWTHRRTPGLQLHLRRPYGSSDPLGNKPWSWVRIDSMKELPSEILVQWWNSGASVELQQKSLDKLRGCLRRRELHSRQASVGMASDRVEIASASEQSVDVGEQAVQHCHQLLE